MAGNSFGQAFRITTAGESPGPGNVVIIDGVTEETDRLLVLQGGWTIQQLTQ